MKKENKHLIIAFILFYIVISISIIGGYVVIRDENIKENKECRNAGLEDNCNFIDKECAIDCKYMDMKFHHRRWQGFGADDCFCINEEEKVRNIW